MPETYDDLRDLLIIGGGVNGCAIARDAAGRGLSVILCEKGDLAQATSSASTKLLHGGLRYLEHYEFRLVREALREREVLLANMPHIAWPLRFVLPHHAGLRPAWRLRLGLLLYDHLGGRKRLSATRSVDFGTDPVGEPLRPDFERGFEYSDCWVDDARLVVLLARDAAHRGATILTRTRFEGAERDGAVWRAGITAPDGTPRTIRARALVNAAGPWVPDTIRARAALPGAGALRLVRGSHIVTRRLFTHDRAYIFQQSDGRIVFAIPYETDFTLIGTTDVDHDGPPEAAQCSAAERDYLLAAIAGYFRRPVTVEDIVWSFSGVRALHDDGAKSAAAATRDYNLALDGQPHEPPALDVFGGKITTHRRLAEAALAKLAPHFPGLGPAWTRKAPLPGGNLPVGATSALGASLRESHPFLDENWARRLARSYGTEASLLLDGARSLRELGHVFGATLTEREVRWMQREEWAVSPDDILWRRSKLGLRFTAAERRDLAAWLGSGPAGH